MKAAENPAPYVSVVTERGQVSIPAEIRRQLGLDAGQHLQWEVVSGHELRVRPVADQPPVGALSVLGYARRTINADLGENLTTLISMDGQSWQTLDTAHGPDYASVTFPLPSGHPRLHIRFVFVANSPPEAGFVDDVFVVGTRAMNLAFVTSQSWAGGALGGLAGADAKCNAAAVAAGLGGTYVAWLSDSQNDARKIQAATTTEMPPKSAARIPSPRSRRRARLRAAAQTGLSRNVNG